MVEYWESGQLVTRCPDDRNVRLSAFFAQPQWLFEMIAASVIAMGSLEVDGD